MAIEKIGDWDKVRLARFVERAIATGVGANLPPSLIGEELRSTGLLVVENDLEISPQAIQYLKDVLGLP